MFPSPFLNPVVVHRSASLLRDAGDEMFGTGFRFREGTVTEATVPKPAAAPVAVSLSLFTVGFGALGRIPARLREPMADWLLHVGPKAGSGPRARGPRRLALPARHPGHRRPGRPPGRRRGGGWTPWLQVDRHDDR